MGIRRAVLAVVFVCACGGGGGDDDTPPSCSSDTDCSGATAACDTGAMQCVQCTDVSAAACTGATPACNPDHTCHAACNADSECASGACLGDGSCAAPANVLWVGLAATGATCGPADKCAFATALGMAAAPRDIIHLDPATYPFPAGFMLDKDVHIAGRGATFVIATGTAFRVVNGHDVTIDGLALGGAPGTVPDEGIECTNAKLTARVVTVAFTAFTGINASGCTLALQRSTLHDNAGGALVVGGGGVFAIANNYIWHNGNIADGNVGGVQLLGSVPAGSSLEFNTIVDNHANAGALNSGGVACNTVGFAAPNNLIARNDLDGNTTSVNAQAVGACSFPTSIIQKDVAGLNFVSPDAVPYSYKLAAGSMAVDMAKTVSTIVFDNDGDARPQGADKDIGADELAP